MRRVPGGRIAAVAVLAAAALAAGCGRPAPAPAPSPPGPGGGVGGTGAVVVGGVATTASFVSLGDGTAFVLWSDLPLANSKSDASGACSGRHASADGRAAVAWRCQARGTAAEVAGVRYDLTAGRLFLVRAAGGGPPRVLQLRRDTLPLPPGREKIVELARDPEVAAFFAAEAAPHTSQPSEGPT